MRILKALMWFAIWFAATFVVMAIIGLGGHFLFQGLLLIRVIDVNTFLDTMMSERIGPFFTGSCMVCGLIIVIVIWRWFKTRCPRCKKHWALKYQTKNITGTEKIKLPKDQEIKNRYGEKTGMFVQTAVDGTRTTYAIVIGASIVET